MLCIYEKYEDNDQVVLFFYIIDVKCDIVGKFKKYVIGLGIDIFKWCFVIGDCDFIYFIIYDYISMVFEVFDVFGGFDYFGWVLFIDKDWYFCVYVDGIKEEKVDEFMK